MRSKADLLGDALHAGAHLLRGFDGRMQRAALVSTGALLRGASLLGGILLRGSALARGTSLLGIVLLCSSALVLGVRLLSSASLRAGLECRAL